jgi:hypothetical protein
LPSWIRIRIRNLYADPDPDPTAQINADPSGSGSETLFLSLFALFLFLFWRLSMQANGRGLHGEANWNEYERGMCFAVSLFSRLRITLMRIRIQLFTLMRI